MFPSLVWTDEKTKWVAIPAQEMQAAVDALHPNRHNHHSHHRSRAHPRNQGTAASGSASASSSASGQGSQVHSRTQSTSGGRRPPHSNVGSILSSPLRGSGKPIDDNASLAAPPTNATGSRSISVRSSRVGSPNLPAPSLPSFPTAKPAQINTNRPLVNGSAIPPQNGIFDGAQQRTTPYEPRPTPYPPSVAVVSAGPQSHNSSFPSSRASGSPVTHPYTLPPFPADPSRQAPYASQGVPPYALYPPYPYAYPAAPYMYWGVPPQPYAHSSVPPGEGVPPSTMMGRPPASDESDSMTGYRDTGFVMPPTAAYPAPAADYSVPSESERDQSGTRGRRQRELSFGSISAVADANKTPSPPMAAGVVTESDDTNKPAESGGLGLDTGIAALSMSEGPRTGKDESGRSFTAFSIGVDPEEAESKRIRSRTRTGSKASRRGDGAISKSTSEQTDALPEAGDAEERKAGGIRTASLSSARKEEGAVRAADSKVIDLTDSESKWQFGSTKQAENTEDTSVPEAVQEPQADESGLASRQSEGQSVDGEQAGFSMAPNALGVLPGTIPAPIPVAGPVPLSYPPAQGTVPPHGYAGGAMPSLSLMTNGYPPFSPPYAVPGSLPSSSVTDISADEWKVKDYGFGFGRGGPSTNGGYSASRDDRQYRNEREREWEQRGYPQQDREFYGRSRRGSYNTTYNNYDRGGHDRGGFGGRRGRGGYGRGFARGSRGVYVGSQRQSTFTMSQPQPLPTNDMNGYYAPMPPPMATYIPTYDPYGYPEYQPIPPPAQGMPPTPMPLSTLSFPLDPVRFRLLGQLEYYLSPQNMAQDLYLRRKA